MQRLLTQMLQIVWFLLDMIESFRKLHFMGCAYSKFTRYLEEEQMQVTKKQFVMVVFCYLYQFLLSLTFQLYLSLFPVAVLVKISQ